MKPQIAALLEAEYPNYLSMTDVMQFRATEELKVKLLREEETINSLVRKEARDLSTEEAARVDTLIASQFDLMEIANKFQNQFADAADFTPINTTSPPGASLGSPQSQPDRGPVFALENGEEIRALLPGERLAERFPSEDTHATLGQLVRSIITGEAHGGQKMQAAAGEGVGSLGGFFLSEQVSANVIDLARNQSVLVRGGALTIPMTSAEMTIVRQLTDVTGTWRAEHTKIAESKPTFEPIRLRAVALAALVRVSIELMEDAAGFGQLIENAIGASLALEMDRAGIFGTGTNEPRGVVNTPGVNEISMGPNGTAFTNYDPFLDAIEKVENANGMAGAVSYAPRTKRALAGLKTGISGDQTPLVPPKDFTDLSRFSSNQFPVNETKGTSSNTSTALLGDYAQIGFGVRTALRIEATRWGDEKAFSQLEVLIRGYLRVDVAVLRPAHLTKITGIKP